MDPQTRRLADIEAIRRLKAAYGIAFDDLIATCTPENGERFGALFTEEVEAKFGDSPATSGRAAIVDFIAVQVRSRRAWMWHSFHSPLIEVDGDTATGRWTVHCVAMCKGAAKADTIIGRYRDRYVRTPGGWLQSALVFVNETPAHM